MPTTTLDLACITLTLTPRNRSGIVPVPGSQSTSCWVSNFANAKKIVSAISRVAKAGTVKNPQEVLNV